MPEVVPLKVKLYPNKNNRHPDFKNNLAVFQQPGYKGAPIWYDRTCDCKTALPDSPIGEMWAMKLVDKDFADQAVAAFPNRCFKMTEAEAEDFWNNRVKANRSENQYNIDVLQGLKLQYEIMEILGNDTTEIKTKMAKAINPLDNAVGIKKDKTKTWIDMKKEMDITVKP